MAHPREFAEGLSIGIIMDGNGRWAKNRGLPRTAGHKKGAEVFSDIADYCDELGVSSVYFYAFSTENWKRPLEEVNAIMKAAAESDELCGVLGYNDLPLVSCDFNHDPHSSTFDATLTKVSGGRLVKVTAWYDNEHIILWITLLRC